MESLWVTAVQNLGIPAVIVLGMGFIIWKVILPAVIEQFKAYQLQQQKQIEAAVEQQKLLQAYYVEQIRALQTEARADKQMMFEAFKANTEANTQLKGALEGVTDQLTSLATEVSTVKNDMTKVYLILGNDKKLIEKQ